MVLIFHSFGALPRCRRQRLRQLKLEIEISKVV